MARGCQFVIRLPLARSDAPAEMAPVASPANGGRLLTNSQGVN